MSGLDICGGDFVVDLPMDMFWGDRYGWVRDPYGHVWVLNSVREVLSVQEIQRRMQQFSERTR